ncbi:neuroligin-2-like [Amphibalanus amphitrite]|uniref:neuroligin-2-like n=1 Tax=Amphibalanus amphitrite TaxID=1232801 RepID=UPI001C91E7DC|nr:neuroligin-2-like [Amphibalanus amphitrite]
MRTAGLLVLVVAAAAGLARDQLVETSVGPLRGLLSPVVDVRLPRVMQFLGVPYASPPVDYLRFMPPKTPIRKSEVLNATRLPAGCPQREPAAGSRRQAGPAPPQSEDCLYLNIYAPVTEDAQRHRYHQRHRLPVLVYIHGESAGDQARRLDGTVLASFGGVIVVTVNYRLGVLGFLKPTVTSGSTFANFALYDQRAALSWLQDNIEQFGGDPTNVTVMGHGTGAVCSSLLAVSPLNSNPDVLFQRVILMSGSSLSPWAMTADPINVTVSVARALNCSMQSDHQLLECLRSKPVRQLVNVDFPWPRYAPSLSPSEDHIVVPRWPRDAADLAHSLSRFELLFGVTTQGDLGLLSERQLRTGLSREERDRLISSLFRAGYRRYTRQLLDMATNRYMDAQMNVIRYRDKTLQLLSDAMVVAPLVRLADLHAQSTSRSYMYVFSHVTDAGGDRQFGSVPGDELPYVFGVPLAPQSNLFFTRAEKALSEYMMTAWSSFVKTGDPNGARKQEGFISEPSGDSPFYDLIWRQYDKLNQRYLELGTRPRESSQYRHVELDFWNRVVLGHLASSPGAFEGPMPEDYDNLMPMVPPPAPGGPLLPPPPLAPSTPPPRQYPHTLSPPPAAAPGDSRHGDSGGDVQETAPATATGMLSIVVVVGVCFVLLNLLILGGVYYQKQRLKVRERRLQRQSSLSEAGSRSVSVRGSRESVLRPRLLARSASGDDLLDMPVEGNGGVPSARRASEGSVSTRRAAEGGAREPLEAGWSCGERAERASAPLAKERSLDRGTVRDREQHSKAAVSRNSSRSSTLGRERPVASAGSRSGSVRSRNSVASASLPRSGSGSLHGSSHQLRPSSAKQNSKSANKVQTKKKGITLPEKSLAQGLLQRVMPRTPTEASGPTTPSDRPPRGILKTRPAAGPASDSSGIYSETVPALRGSVSGLSTGSGCRVVYRTDSTCQVDLPDDPEEADHSAAGREPDSASVGSARSLQLSCSSSVGGRSSSSLHFVPRPAALAPEPRAEPAEFPTVRFETDPVEDRDDVPTALRSTRRPETAGYRRSIAGVPGTGGGQPVEAARSMSLQRTDRRARQKPPPPPRTCSRPEGLYAARDVTCPHGYPVHPPPPGTDSLERFVPGQAESPDPAGAARVRPEERQPARHGTQF